MEIEILIRDKETKKQITKTSVLDRHMHPSRVYNDMTMTTTLYASPFQINMYISRDMTKEEMQEYDRQGHLQKTKTTFEKFEETKNNKEKIET